MALKGGVLTFNALRGIYGGASTLRPDGLTTQISWLDTGDGGGVGKESVFELGVGREDESSDASEVVGEEFKEAEVSAIRLEYSIIAIELRKRALGSPVLQSSLETLEEERG